MCYPLQVRYNITKQPQRACLMPLQCSKKHALKAQNILPCTSRQKNTYLKLHFSDTTQIMVSLCAVGIHFTSVVYIALYIPCSLYVPIKTNSSSLYVSGLQRFVSCCDCFQTLAVKLCPLAIGFLFLISYQSINCQQPHYQLVFGNWSHSNCRRAFAVFIKVNVRLWAMTEEHNKS